MHRESKIVLEFIISAPPMILIRVLKKPYSIIFCNLNFVHASGVVDV